MHVTTALFSLLAIASFSSSQQPGQTPAKTAAATTFVVEAGEMTLPNLIDRCAAFLDCNILSSQQELASAGPGGGLTVRFQKRVETDREGCTELLATMLYRSGFALTILDKGMFEVIQMSGPRGREIGNRARHQTVEQVMARPDLKLAVTVMVPLQHTNATMATNALRPFFASTGSPQGGASLTLGNVGNSSALLLHGMQDQVAQAIRLLRECDVPPANVAPDLEQRLDTLERRLKAIEERLQPPAPQQPPQGK
jgi:hypothetical protein